LEDVADAPGAGARIATVVSSATAAWIRGIAGATL
jgi:hypothetical protein